MKIDAANVSIEAGDRLLAEDRLGEADASFDAAARKQPDDPEPLAGLIRVARRRKDIQALGARLERFLQLCPDAIDERANWLQIIANRGELERARSEIPALLDRADRASFVRPTGRRLLQLIQSCLTGSARVHALARLRDRVEANLAGRSQPQSGNHTSDRARSDRSRNAEATKVEAEPHVVTMLRVFLSEVHLALGDRAKFSSGVEALPGSPRAKQHCDNLGRVREKIESEAFPDFNREKIFGIGLSRTGTLSLNTALNRLGFHSIHWTNPMTMDIIGRDDFLLFDAFTDISVSHQFEWLYHTFPKSKFIVTSRDAQSWVRSVVLHYQNNHGHRDIRDVGQSPSRLRFRGKPALIHENIYGGVDNWRDAYTRYHERVHAFFGDKPKERFLEMSIVGGDGYEELCPFLGVPVPDKPFPNSNSSAERVMVPRGTSLEAS